MQIVTGRVLPLHAAIFAPFNLIPVIVLVTVLPFALMALEPRRQDVVTADVAKLAETNHTRDEAPNTVAEAQPRTLARSHERGC